MSRKMFTAENAGMEVLEHPGIGSEQEKNQEKNEYKIEQILHSGGVIALPVQGVNSINKGSKFTGNIHISQDLMLIGDVEGNITGEEKSNIFIKGSCKGNIKTAGGSVEIEGDMSGGDIVAGGYVKITGKFHGGRIQAKEKIHINGEFTGSLESNEVEVGAAAHGKGEIFYREALSIEKGAKVEGRISRIGAERKPEPAAKEPKPKKGFFS